MKIGVPTESMEHEDRVALTPAGVEQLVAVGHQVYVQAGAGVGAAMADQEYRSVGAGVVDTADEVWAESELVVKVEAPVEGEFERMRPGQVLFCYLHLAASRRRTEALLEHGVTAIAYEEVQGWDGVRPLRVPMSEIAGRLAVQVGARHRTRPAVRVVVLGAGVVGTSAVAAAAGCGAEVALLDVDPDRLREVDRRYRGRVRTCLASGFEVARALCDADLVIGAVGVPVGPAPTIVTSEMVADMRSGAVLVDVAIDEGGCFEGSRPTTLADPTFAVHGTRFCCVPNLPSVVPRIATRALTDATLSYVDALAGKGVDRAVREDRSLALGLSTCRGRITSEPVAATHDLPFARAVAS
ncbi:alanine dehydrogenase [Pseudonocardia hispaniensis]|uniref:alanine dehydrogenase n=1 Tax=Pseudonocardia hispaniensis TaxID=904933 RepID=A0ABW1J4F7_9PSEU